MASLYSTAADEKEMHRLAEMEHEIRDGNGFGRRITMSKNQSEA